MAFGEDEIWIRCGQVFELCHKNRKYESIKLTKRPKNSIKKLILVRKDGCGNDFLGYTWFLFCMECKNLLVLCNKA